MPRKQREEHMLAAAEQVFGAQGFRGASMEEIARLSGITKALLYQYFDSKERLYEACVERERDQLFVRIEGEVARASSPVEQLQIFVGTYFEFLAEHRSAWWLLYGEASARTINDIRARNAEFILGLLRATVEAADGRVNRQSLELLAHALVGAGEQVGRWFVERPDVSRKVVVQRFAAIALGAIGATFDGAR
jgi:AcrR family transcriptional regulator